ncbi:MAG TPA: LamG domain-containing protein, partial [Actinomycetota bacterium]
TFSHVNGVYRSDAAAFNTSTGALTAWNPGATGPVQALAVSADNSTVYMGGSFAKVKGNAHSRLAAVNATTGVDLPWAATADGTVFAIALSPDGSRVIVGGQFVHLDGVAQHGIGAVDPITGLMEPWAYDPVPPTSAVKTIITDGSGHAFIGAEGTGGGVLDGTFAVNYLDGSKFWFDNCLGATQALVLLNGWLYDGSHMHDCQGQVPGGPPQQPNTWWHITVESPVDGHVGHFFPYTSGNPLGPKTMTTDGTQLFVGGDFLNVHHVAQQGLTRFAPGADSQPAKPAAPIVSSNYCANAVTVSFTSTTDFDDGLLTYNLFRDSSLTPIYTTTLETDPWQHPVVAFTDTGVLPGSTHTYKVNASDGTLTSAKGVSAPVTVSTTQDAYPCAVVSDGPQLYWRLDDAPGSTTAADASGAGHTGNIRSGVTLGQSGALSDGDLAARLSGTSTGLVTSSTSYANPQTFSIEAWFKTSSGYNRGGKIVGFGSSQTGTSGSYDRHIYMTNSGSLIFGVYENFTATIQSPSSYNDGNWHQVVATIDPVNGMAMYVDGNLVASHAVDGSGNYGWAQAYTGYWRVGTDNLSGWPSQPTNSSFSGSVDDVAIYGSALSAGQVATHYAAR